MGRFQGRRALFGLGCCPEVGISVDLTSKRGEDSTERYACGDLVEQPQEMNAARVGVLAISAVRTATLS